MMTVVLQPVVLVVGRNTRINLDIFVIKMSPLLLIRPIAFTMKIIMAIILKVTVLTMLHNMLMRQISQTN